MGIVFAVLVLLALSIKVLGLLDRDPAADSAVLSSTADPAPAPDGEITGQQVAAIAVALALSEPKATSTSPPSGLTSPGPSTGSWLQSGRMRSLGTGRNVGGRRGQ